MGLFDAAKKAVSAARDMAAEVLGEDGMEQLKSIKDDVVQAGGQVGQFAREVLEDCDNDALSDAKDFYSKAYDRSRDKVRKAQEKARAEREARERERLRMREKRLAMLRKGAVILICAIFAAILIISVALWFNQRDRSPKAPAPTPETAPTATAVTPTAAETAPASDMTEVPVSASDAPSVAPTPSATAAPTQAPAPTAALTPSTAATAETAAESSDPGMTAASTVPTTAAPVP
ncbi:MAG: hypothetical protein K6C12_00925 [Oscillospiraceae bacterium]|nr:hypothetical protein [Oscillospiraceae bacterium]